MSNLHAGLLKSFYVRNLLDMAKYASVWTTTDVGVMNLISKKRDESPFQISDRALARAIDVSAPRIGDLFGHRHGSPSLREFIALCQVFNLSPASTLEKAMRLSERADELEERKARLDRVAAHPEDYDIAANYDPNKELERETPRD